MKLDFKLKKLVEIELYNWKWYEILWLLIAIITIIGLSSYCGDSIVGIISATTGVICVILTGKGKLSAYFFGTINCILYAIISFNATLYGETMLNLLYYLPLQFYGFYLWSKNINPKNKEVIKKKMSNKNRILILSSIIITTLGYGVILSLLGDKLPYIDSFTTITSIFAMYISVKMYAEQWWIWVVVNIFSIYMWCENLMSGHSNIATLLMWILFLMNSIYGLVKWELESNKEEYDEKTI